MRKHLILMTAVFAAIACSVEQPIDYFEDSSIKEQKVIITASLGDDTPVKTRTTQADKTKVYWLPNDEISIFAGSKASKFTSMNEVAAPSAYFEGLISVISGTNENEDDSYIYGLYPYDESATYSEGKITTTLPSVQTGRPGTFDDDLMITMGRSHSFKIPFHHACSSLHFTLANEGIESVTLTANGGETLAGTFSAAFGEDGYPIIQDDYSNSSSSITVNAPEGETFEPGVTYYIVTLPVTFSQGISLTFKTATSTGTRKINSSFSLNQGAFKTLTNADNNVEFETDDQFLPLCLEAVEDGTVTISNPLGLTLEYSKDLNNWTSESSETIEIPVATADKVYLKGYNDAYSDGERHTTISSSGNIYAYGNVMSLINRDTFGESNTLSGAHTFEQLFYNNKHLFSHESRDLILPATTLTESCYRCMFALCENFSSAPELPAITLAERCYDSMFWDCALTKAPALPATKLYARCYYCMFRGCTKLVSAPVLPAEEMAHYCYSYMFWGCTSLTVAPELPSTSMAMGCYHHMFEDCPNLVTAPVLPAKNLNPYCYNGMFKGCSSLNHIEMMATDIFVSSGSVLINNMEGWVEGVATTGTFVKADDAIWDVTGPDGVPEGWTVY